MPPAGVPTYRGMEHRRRTKKSGGTTLSKKHMDFSPALLPPPGSPSRTTPRAAIAPEGSPRSRRVVIAGVTVKPLGAAAALVPRPPSVPPSVPSALAAEPTASPSASPNRRLGGGRFMSRDYSDDPAMSPAVQWGSVRGTRNVLTKKVKASDSELTRALSEITKTLSQQVAGGTGLTPECTCWVGGIPEECADQASLTAAFEPVLSKQIRSMAVRTKPGDAKCWALVVFKTAAAAAAARSSSFSVTDGQGEQRLLIVRESDVGNQMQREKSSGLMHAAREAKANATQHKLVRPLERSI